MPKSSPRRKPKKPRPDFPLFAHATGRWAKKIKGKLYCFGPWDQPDQALQLYLDQQDDLYAGRQPRNADGEIRIRDLCNHFLTDRKHRLDAGDIVLCTFEDYRETCDRIVSAFGKRRSVTDLRPEDFLKLRGDMAKTLGPVALGNEVNRVRIVFNFAYEASLIDVPVLETDLAVSRVAKRCSFYETKYLCEAFRNFEGVTATEYRQNSRLG